MSVTSSSLAKHKIPKCRTEWRKTFDCWPIHCLSIRVHLSWIAKNHWAHWDISCSSATFKHHAGYKLSKSLSLHTFFLQVRLKIPYIDSSCVNSLNFTENGLYEVAHEKSMTVRKVSKSWRAGSSVVLSLCRYTSTISIFHCLIFENWRKLAINPYFFGLYEYISMTKNARINDFFYWIMLKSPM